MSANVLTGSPVWTGLGWTMLHLLWVGGGIGLLGVIARRLLRPVRPEIRYGVALAVLTLLACAPIAIFIHVFQPASRPVNATREVAKFKQLSDPASSLPMDATADPRLTPRDSIPDSSVSRAISYASLDVLVPYLPGVWLVGSSSTLIMLATGLIGVEQLRRSSRLEIAGDLPTRCRVLADSLGIARCVGTGICDRLRGPVLVGIIRPLILLPPVALTGWSVEQIEMVLLHELAHVRRWDNLVNLIQRVVESLLFFHPVVWWLSAWVRLERELCCDRLVVDRLGRPLAYAEMLVAVAGPNQRSRRAVLAMADRQVMTRIRRLLNLEDRSMKMTMPEGLGVLVAVIVGVALAVGSQAAPLEKPVGESEESVRKALRQMLDEVVKETPDKRLAGDREMLTLMSITEAQLKVGDRASALETLKRISATINQIDPKEDMVGVFGMLPQIARYQREAGDLNAARATLDRLSAMVQSLKNYSRVEKLRQVTGVEQPRWENHEVGAMVRCELLVLIAEERIALGDRDQAMWFFQHAVEEIQSQKDVLKPLALAEIGCRLYKAGEQNRARAVIDQARQSASEFTRPEDKDGALPRVAKVMAETGNLEGSMEIVKKLGNHGRSDALRMIIESFAEDDLKGGSLDLSGIKIVIGASSTKVKDRALTVRAMPRIARTVLDINDTLMQVRTLAIISNLQASAGDFRGARNTAELIPDIERKDFPVPSDGFYDAVKPATVAIDAAIQGQAGDKSGEREAFDRALAMARSVRTPSQKIVAQIVIVQKQIECGDLAEAKALIGEVIPFAMTLPEPVRSRSLAMLAECQANAGDRTGPLATIDAIRDYPGLEKTRALKILAHTCEQAGDTTMAKSLRSRALTCAEAKIPEKTPVLTGKVRPMGAVGARTFIDFEAEIEPGIITFQKQTEITFLRSRLVNTADGLRVARSLPVGARGLAVSSLAGDLAHRGRVSEALELARNLETAEDRLTAFQVMASVIRDRQKTE